MAPLVIMGLILLAGCEGCYSSRDANDAAAVATRKAVIPRLEQLAAASPDDAEQVRLVIDRWDTRTERENYRLARPLLERLADQSAPDTAESIQRTVRTWGERLDRFGL